MSLILSLSAISDDDGDDVTCGVTYDVTYDDVS